MEVGIYEVVRVGIIRIGDAQVGVVWVRCCPGWELSYPGGDSPIFPLTKIVYPRTANVLGW